MTIDNMKTHNSIGLCSILLVSLALTIIICSCGRTKVDNPKVLRSNIDSEIGIHPALLYAIKQYNKPKAEATQIEIDYLKKEDYWTDAMDMTNNPRNRYYMVIKFFKKNDELYFSIWQNYGFPEYIKTPVGSVKVDENNLFFFQLGLINVAIIDFPDSNGHDLYAQNEQRKYFAQEKKKEYDTLDIKIIDKDSEYETYLIKDGMLIKDSSKMPSKYKNEHLLEVVK